MKYFSIRVMIVVLFCMNIGIAHSKKKYTPLVERSLFFKADCIRLEKVSSDGAFFTYVQKENDIEDLFLKDISSGKTIQLTNSRQNKIIDYQWSKANNYIYIVTEALDNYYVSYIRFDKKSMSISQEVRHLTQLATSSSFIQASKLSDDIVFVGEKDRYGDNYKLVQYQTISGRSVILRDDYFKAAAYLIDNNGEARAIKIYDEDSGKEYLVRLRDRFTADTLFASSANGNLEILGWSAENNRFFVENTDEDGFKTLYQVNTQNKKLTLIEVGQKHVDEVSNIFFDLKTEKVLGYAIGNQELDYVWNDSTLWSIYDTIVSHFPDVKIHFFDARPDVENVVFTASSSQVPGDIYSIRLKDFKIQYLESVSKTLKQLQTQFVGSEKFMFKNDENPVNAYVTYPQGKRKKLPLVVLIQDVQQKDIANHFNPELQFLLSRGYAVLQVDYNEELKDDFIKSASEKIQTAVKLLIQQKIIDESRVAVMGNGFGGFLSLVIANLYPDLFKSVISLSAYNNLWSYLNHVPKAWKQERNQVMQSFGKRSLEELKRLSDTYSPYFHVEKIKSPVLAIYGENDPKVNTNEIRIMYENLQQNDVKTDVLRIKGEGEDFLLPINQKIKYLEIEKFLNATISGNYHETSSASFNQMIAEAKVKSLENIFIGVDTLPKVRLKIYSNWNSDVFYQTLRYGSQVKTNQMNMKVVQQGNRWAIEKVLFDEKRIEVGTQKAFLDERYIPSYIEANLNGQTEQTTFVKDSVYIIANGQKTVIPAPYPYIVDFDGIEYFIGALPLQAGFKLDINLFDYAFSKQFKQVRIELLREEEVDYREYFVVKMYNLSNPDDETIFWINQKDRVLKKSLKTIPEKGNLTIETRRG